MWPQTVPAALILAAADFNLGKYKTASTAPVPPQGSIQLAKTLKVQNEWLSVLTGSNAGAEPVTQDYNQIVGVIDTETVSYAVEVGVTLTVGGSYGPLEASLSASLNITKQTDYSFSFSTQTTTDTNYPLPSNSTVQLWQLLQTFNISNFSVSANPADPWASDIQTLWGQVEPALNPVPAAASFSSNVPYYYALAGPLANQIYPDDVKLSPGDNQQFVAGFAPGVTAAWSTIPAETGTVTSGGLYTAPDSGKGNVTIQASPSNGGTPATTTVNLTGP
jgi:hypothetical protein